MTGVRPAPTAVKAADSASAAKFFLAKRTASRRAVPGVSAQHARAPRGISYKSSIASRTAQPANHRQRSSVPTSESSVSADSAAEPTPPLRCRLDAAQKPRNSPRAANSSASKPTPLGTQKPHSSTSISCKTLLTCGCAPKAAARPRTFGAACLVRPPAAAPEALSRCVPARCPAGNLPEISRQMPAPPAFRLRRMFPVRALYRRPQHQPRRPRAAQRRLCRPHQRPARRAVSAPPQQAP